MTAFLTTLVLGVLVCVIGIINMTGNISSLHSYHRKRVAENKIGSAENEAKRIVFKFGTNVLRNDDKEISLSITFWILFNSSIKYFLLCNLPAVSISTKSYPSLLAISKPSYITEEGRREYPFSRK